MTNFPGLFVTIEGVDGSGKSTLIREAEEKLDNVVSTREPAEHLWTGKQARHAINEDDSHPMTDFHFFVGDRANHIQETILPALEDGLTVISDRYSDSTRAYQREVLKGVVPDPDEYINYTLSHSWHLEPDLTILIDLPAEESARRTSEGDKYEKSEFIEKVRQNYLNLEAESDRILLIDGTKPKKFVSGMGVTMIEEAQIQKAVNDFVQ